MSRPVKFFTKPTPRQLDVLIGLKAGLSNKEIAKELNISPRVVKHHVEQLMQKARVRSRKAFCTSFHGRI